MNKHELLKSLFLFDGLDFTLIDSTYGISDSVMPVSYRDGELILSTENDTRGLALIESGSARIISGDNLRPVVLRTVCTGESFGAASLFRTSGDFNTRVVAEGDCRVLFIPKGTVIRLCTAVPQVCFNYLGYLSDRTAFLNKKISAFTAGSAEARLAIYLSGLPCGENGEATIDVSLSSLAMMLGIGRASLYRALDNLSDSGIIERSGKSVTLVKPDKLRQLIQ